MNRNRYLPKRFDRLLVLLLSTTAHLGVVGLTLGNGMLAESRVMPSLPGTTAVVMASLYAPDSAAQTGQPVVTNPEKIDNVADAAIAALAGSEEPVAESADSQIDSTEMTVQKTNEAADIFPTAEPVEAVYLRTDELTKAPSVLLDISSDLSLFSPNGLPQLAILRLLVNERGDIDQVLVEDSPLPEEEQNLLKNAFSKTKFHPGEINGTPVRSQLRIEVMLNNVVNQK